MILYPSRTFHLYCVIYNAILLATELRRVKPTMHITRTPRTDLYYELDENEGSSRLDKCARRWRRNDTGSSKL